MRNLTRKLAKSSETSRSYIFFLPTLVHILIYKASGLRIRTETRWKRSYAFTHRNECVKEADFQKRNMVFWKPGVQPSGQPACDGAVGGALYGFIYDSRGG